MSAELIQPECTDTTGLELEWDESDLTRCLPESDALSAYDANEMAEILRHHFLEFDMISQAAAPSTHRPKHKAQRSLSDCRFTGARQPVKRSSLPELCSLSVGSKAKRRASFSSTAHLMQMEPEAELFAVVTSTSLPHLSAFDKLRRYLKTFNDKLCTLISRTLHSPQPPVLIEHLIETYDIIDTSPSTRV